MELRGLQTFVAVVDHGGFRAASRELYESQTAVSRRIARLEAELGVQLVLRDQMGGVPSPDGEALLPYIREVLRAVDEFEAASQAPRTWTLRLGIPPAVAGFVLARFLAKWLSQHPHVRIVTIEDGMAKLRSRLEDRECDLALMASPLPSNVEGHFVRTVTLQALIPSNHALAARPSEPLSVGELRGEPLVANGRPFTNYELFEAACRLADIRPTVVYETSDPEVLAMLAEAEVGIGVTGDLMRVDPYDLISREVCAIDGATLQFDLWLAWKEDAALPRAADLFLEDISAFLAEERTAPAGRLPKPPR